jgi:hypothetical protein
MGFGRTVRATLLSPFVGQRLRPLISKPNQADLETLRELVDSGRVKPVIDRAYSLEEVPEVVDQLGSGNSRGIRAITI